MRKLMLFNIFKLILFNINPTYLCNYFEVRSRGWRGRWCFGVAYIHITHECYDIF